MTTRCLLVLPTYGVPYTFGSPMRSNNKERLSVLQKAVDGYIEEFSKSSFEIHPDFKRDDRWFVANELKKHRSTKVYVNDNGLRECVPNMSTIVTCKYQKEYMSHLHGDVVLDITMNAFQTITDRTGIRFSDKPQEDEEEEESEEEDDEEDPQ